MNGDYSEALLLCATSRRGEGDVQNLMAIWAAL